MNLSIRVLGLELLTIDLSTDDQPNGPGDCTTSPVGFVRDESGHEWQRGVER